MRAHEFIPEEILDEMPLPADWDTTKYGPGSSFRSRLAYALERAKKLGTGSSRVAMTIEYDGRPTVLKIAKNARGLAQNQAEADILGDGYASQLGILIPMIDCDEQNSQPVWIHTELAQKTTDKQLCALMQAESLIDLVKSAEYIVGRRGFNYYDAAVVRLRQMGKSDEQIEVFSDYCNVLADLKISFDMELGDLTRKANWGVLNGKPVIIDAGFTTNVRSQHYS